ncbi:aldehyde dehydrogenase family protein [Pseudarthrobacter sp. BIM B-2242]|jgi:acyl-CoA reductase-like NAD-dependent aldehyde dehydrogenase|uniref:aldehyde dehydrogenase family protein n=1 Tax=Pseudarthrobacter sp. BIM B-2242 TaxID=2772401 RepID=UPI00168B9184|nr:aldehyde dehydrogenase family protein [Pseudarthrobacter sp. BIM B-2242]QOD03100.1 aldehyde dehydrogenase family protein [Pseudarthrobacter sp. BIM B-2242]
MQMLIAGTWRGAADGRTEDVRSPFDGRIIDTVPVATVEDAQAALDRAEIGAHLQRATPAHVRVDILLRAAALADERAEDIAQAISAETGKPITEARGEASRSGNIIRLAAYEGSQLYGSTLPLDANAGTGLDKIGFTLRQPVGIVVAITPFNYPALLVLHKIAPALAAGNAVVLKPARATPLTALKLAQCFVDAGLPPEALSVLTGPGSTLGDVLVTDPRVRKVSFTGSTATGTRISSIAGVKKLSLELGASCPVIILPDADLELASSAVAAGGFINSGQVCISVQRVIVDRRVEADFLDALVPKVEAIAVGNPKEADTRLGSLISEEEAIRVHTSIGEARNSGAKVLTGGDRDGAVITPAVVAGVDPRSPLSRNELFGPAVAVSSATDIESAIAMANDNDYGLGAGIFTSDVSGSIQAMRQIDAGNIHINWTPLWRADLMPYGGLKGSGIGKEGVRSAVNEMTEEKTVILHGRPW